MLPNNLHHFVRHQRYQDLQREAEQARVIRAVRNQQHRKLYHLIASWIGVRLVAWGCAFQQCSATACCTEGV
jgi:hypothetical protein